MNVFKNTKTMKKFILVIVFLILFNVCYPKQVHAVLEMEDVIAAPCKIIYMIESGILEFLNNIFCDKNNQDDGVIYVSPETIIKGKFVLMDANIFNKIEKGDSNYYDSGAIVDGDENNKEFGSSILSGRKELRDMLSGWYYSLRNLSIVALLSVLVYVGIRMIISSVSQDKAKYKMMLKDWLIALCLLFAMHYIMIGILNISTMITNAIGSSGQNINFTEKSMIIIDNVTGKEADKDHYTWEDTNGEVGEVNKEYDISDGYAQCLILGAIIVYTIIFAVKYLIRMITIVFLILLAPITCITYPIDKISDGKAQAYNMWFQEFLYNVIIQPFHLLIYIVLVGSATTLANTNVLYGIMCFAVMIPAEKFIKQMFGFKDKLGSPLGAFATGAISSQLMNKMKSGGGKTVNTDNNKNTELPPNTEKVNLPGEDGENTTGGNDPSPDGGDNPLPGGGNDSLPDGGDNPLPDGGDNPLPGGENDPLPSGGNEPEPDGGNNPELNGGNNSESAQEKNKLGIKERAKNTRLAKAANGRISGHYIRKYGTTKIRGKNGIAARMAKRGLNKAYSGAKNVGRKTIKGATTLVGAAALGLVGAMFGQGKAGMAAGAALGSKIGGSITNATDRGWQGLEGIVGDAYNAKGDRAKEKDKREFKQNENNMLLARKNYKNRHGEAPDGKALDKELENMYNMKSHGVNQEQFNDTLSEYENYIDSGMNEKEAMDTAMLSALQAQIYSGKDFRDEKAMKQAYNELYSQYEPAIARGKISAGAAEEKVRQILEGGARMRGVKKPPLPPRTHTRNIDIPIERRLSDIPSIMGVENSRLTDQDTQTIEKLNIRLHDAGYSDSEIRELASTVANSRMNKDGVIANYETVVEESISYIENPQAQKEVEKVLKHITGSGNISDQQKKNELRERTIVKSTFKTNDEKAISDIRKKELSTFGSDIGERNAARILAKNNSHRLNDTNETQNMIDGIKKDDLGDSQAKKRVKNAREIYGKIVS